MKKIESGKFKQWLKKLKDETGKAKIVARINRLMEGLSGDTAHQIFTEWREQNG